MNRGHAIESQDEDRIPDLGEVLDFMRLLWAVDHGLHSASKRMVRQMGVTGPQRLVIRILGRAPGISAGALARVLYFHPSTLTGVLRRLEDRGFVARTVDPSDGRRVLLSLTSTGREHDDHLPGSVESAIAEALGHQAPASIAAAVTVLMAIAGRLGVDDPL